MKKIRLGAVAGLLLVSAGILLWACLSLVFGYRALWEEVRRQELWTAQGMAGALLEAHPELEREIADALRPENLARTQPLGERILRPYGLADGALPEAARYASTRGLRAVLTLLLPGAAIAVPVLLAVLLRQRERARRDRLLAVLEAYLSEDYTFASRLDPLWKGKAGRLDDLLKQLGNAIRLKNARLVEVQETTKSLVTDISHQLKTPVASLKTCISLALEADSSEEQCEFLERSRQQIDKMESLTGALMNLSRLEIAVIELHPAPTGLRDLLIRAVNAVYGKAREKDIAVELAPFEDMTLELDERWTAEALANVLDNAVKYSPAGTDILIEVERLVSFVRVTIADRGIGIEREEQVRVFQRFYRGSHPLVRASEGAGVGLYLTRMLLERQGGGISVKSSPGQGTVFAVQVRLSQ